LEKLEEACLKFEKAIEFDPEYAGGYYNWGIALARLEKYEEACLKYEKAIEFDPEYAGSYYNWGIILAKLEKFEEACLKYEKAIEFDPEYADNRQVTTKSMAQENQPHNGQKIFVARII